MRCYLNLNSFERIASFISSLSLMYLLNVFIALKFDALPRTKLLQHQFGNKDHTMDKSNTSAF